MYARARRRFRAAHGLELLLDALRQENAATGGNGALYTAAAAAQVLRLYLSVTDQLAGDAVMLVNLGCDTLGLTLLQRVMGSEEGDGGGGGVVGWGELAARVLPLLTLFIKVARCREQVLLGNPQVLYVPFGI